jgi:hypothetical protein
MKIAIKSPTSRSKISAVDSARRFSSQKTTKAPKPIQELRGISNLALQPLQANGFPNPH